MGSGASKAKKSTAASPKSQSKSSADSAKPKMPSSPPADQPAVQAATRSQKQSRNSNVSTSEQSTSASSPSHGSPRDTASPGEGRGFNNPHPARRDTIEQRPNNRQTRMIGAEDMNGVQEALDERPFRQEKVSRVPTKALLKPPKNPNSMIADPDDDYDLY